MLAYLSQKNQLVLDALKNAGVDVTMDPVTGEVLVPVVDYHSARMTLAAQGLPHHRALAMTSLTQFKWDPVGQLKQQN